MHVRCLIDECANSGQIPNLEKLVATIRSREISACLVLQAQSQLKAIYKDNADTIIGNMDSRIFLGSSESTTLKELNQALGAGLGIWEAINLLEGYGNDNPGAKSQGMKQLMAGGGVALIGTKEQILPNVQREKILGWDFI